MYVGGGVVEHGEDALDGGSVGFVDGFECGVVEGG